MSATTEFNVTVELDTQRPPDDFEDQLPDTQWAAVLHQSEHGRVAVTLTLTAANVADAAASGLFLVQGWLSTPAYSVEALPTDEFDRRADAVGVPVLLTTGQASDALGVSEQRVRQLLDAGRLTGRKLGREWLVDLKSVQDRRATHPPRQ
jgi:excisionase family DNA binding protein